MTSTDSSSFFYSSSGSCMSSVVLALSILIIIFRYHDDCFCGIAVDRIGGRLRCHGGGGGRWHILDTVDADI